MAKIKTELFMHKETCATYSVQFLSAGLWKVIDDVDGRAYTLSTKELLTTYYPTGVFL